MLGRLVDHYWGSDDELTERIDGKYKVYKDNKIIAEFNIYNQFCYGKCICDNEYGGKDICEYNGDRYFRTTSYNGNNERLYRLIEHFYDGYRLIEYNSTNVQIRYENMFEKMLKKYGNDPDNEKYFGPLDVAIFHYNDEKISYREKNNKIVKYYKNGYKKSMHKSKNILFY